MGDRSIAELEATISNLRDIIRLKDATIEVLRQDRDSFRQRICQLLADEYEADRQGQLVVNLERRARVAAELRAAEDRRAARAAGAYVADEGEEEVEPQPSNWTRTVRRRRQ